MIYRLDIHDPEPVDHVTAVCCIEAATGVEAFACARRLLADRRRKTPEYAEMFASDGTGQHLYYATVVAL